MTTKQKQQKQKKATKAATTKTTPKKKAIKVNDGIRWMVGGRKPREEHGEVVAVRFKSGKSKGQLKWVNKQEKTKFEEAPKSRIRFNERANDNRIIVWTADGLYYAVEEDKAELDD